MYLFEQSELEVINQMKFEAGLHGVDLDKSAKKDQDKTDDKTDDDQLMFKDPKEYEKMSGEEKKAMTGQMLKKFKGWAGSSVLGE